MRYMWRFPTSDNLLIALFNVNKVDINWWWSWKSHYSFETIVTESKFPCAFLLELQLRKIKQSSTIFPMLHYWPWWRLQMETLSALLAICATNSLVPGEFPPQRPVTWSFYVFVDLHPNKRLSKQSWGWWFETLWRPLWRHCNAHWQWHDDPSAGIYIYKIRKTTSHLQHHIYLWTSLCGSWSYGSTLIVI